MINFQITAQIIVALSVYYVWIFRYDVIIVEFKQFGLNDLTRTFIGAFKIALATLLLTGIWYPQLILFPSIFMGLLMLAAQYYHFKIKNTLVKHLPSFILLILCVYISLASMNII